MAAVRRGQGSMKVELPQGGLLNTDLPPISALFLIYFDVKAGYTIAWKRSLPGIELEGTVEYKSLPSGLHTVKEDLIYFVHERYAGLSAFASAPAAEESRNARMIAVGVLVPLSYGRLGRSWKHADNLLSIAQQLVLAPDETMVLDAYWESHKAGDDQKPNGVDYSIESPSNIRFQPVIQQPGLTKGHNRNRSASDGAFLPSSVHNLSSHHPVWSLSRLLNLFGPLIFPIHRAALLRRRILLCGHAPVRETCDFVYDISVLSNIPFAVTDLLVQSAPPQRLRPLFSIGVHDIPFLEDDLKASTEPPKPVVIEDEDFDEGLEPGHGWIACTTDDILGVKGKLYDLLITLPPPQLSDSKQRIWPKVESPRGTFIKATQRDLRRYHALKWALSRSTPVASSPNRASSSASSSSLAKTLLDTSDTDPIIEPVSWSALAYSGFMWWASAGEQRLGATTDDSDNDNILLDGLSLPDPTIQPLTPARPRSQTSFTQPQHPSTSGPVEDLSARREMAVIAYFHRLTTRILTTLSDLIDAMPPSPPPSSSNDEGEGESDTEETPLRNGAAIADEDVDIDDDNDDAHSVEIPLLYITSADMVKMGLDEWSSADQAFVCDICRAYFGRSAEVEGMSVDICGIRIC